MGVKGKAVIVGGSVGGVSTAHALISAGWEVVVIEKSVSPPKGNPTGAGLGLDPLAQRIVSSWIPNPQLLHDTTSPLAIDQNQATYGEEKLSRVLSRDEKFNFRAAYWTDLHDLLYSALPPDIFLWGYVYDSFLVSQDKKSVQIKAKNVETDEFIEINADLLVAADGCLSAIRQTFLPNLKLRYSGYWAWRGVLDFTGKEDSETIVGIRKAYPELGKCLYFDLSCKTHAVIYELPKKKLNWIWYVHQPEPELKGSSLTAKVNKGMIENLYGEADKVWKPELVRVMKETKEPFLNFMYDCDPLQQLFWDNVVLIGDAAHPTTPHGLRSTNMSILDAAVLGKCLEKWGVRDLDAALEEYQRVRLPVTSKQVLHSRRLGRIRQGLTLPDRECIDPKTASPEDCEELMQKNMPYFDSVPSILGETRY